MKNYIGIDLGTTNSAVSAYDGENLRLFKSPDQNDVTPSAIFIDKRGNRYVGKRAYDNAARNPENAATLFKRLMGTSTPVKLPAVDLTMTPEECSAEILRVLFGYLPEEIRNDPDTGTVITVPAAFNQMQKDATMAAAEMAGLGKVALMQEPVAAVMSVMRHRKGDGMFLVYDLRHRHRGEHQRAREPVGPRRHRHVRRPRFRPYLARQRRQALASGKL